MIRATWQVSRAVNKYKDEYPRMYNDFEAARKNTRSNRKKNTYKIGMKNSWISVSDKAQKEYLQMVEKYLVVKNLPKDNRKVVVTTHNGGKFAGFYEDGKWWYNTLDSVVEVDAHVIKWEKNCF